MNTIASDAHAYDHINQSTKSTVIGLLRQAQTGMSFDVENAKRCIDAAAVLLAADHPVRKAASSGGLTHWQIRRITAFIEVDLSAPLTNKDLAEQIGLSTNHFARAFRQSFACTPHRFVLQRRAERAKILMSTSDEVLSQIALDCGFADQTHFCTVFRSIQGESPNSWRRRFKESPYKAESLGSNECSI